MSTQTTILPSIFQSLLTQLLAGYNTLLSSFNAAVITLSGKITKFAVTNTKTGTTSATLSTASGRVTFSTAVAGTNKQQYTITNTLITANSSVLLTLNYPMSGVGLPSIIFQELTTNTIDLVIANPDAQATNQNLVVDFIILN